MIREMQDDDVGILVNYLLEDYEDVPAGRAIVMNLKGVIENSEFRYVVHTPDDLLVGYYVYNVSSRNTATLASAFMAQAYRHTSYLLELCQHSGSALSGYRLVKCSKSYRGLQMPDKYFNEKRKVFDMKKLDKKVNNGKFKQDL